LLDNFEGLKEGQDIAEAVGAARMVEKAAGDRGESGGGHERGHSWGKAVM
jgi:hypothetical protein